MPVVAPSLFDSRLPRFKRQREPGLRMSKAPPASSPAGGSASTAGALAASGSVRSPVGCPPAGSPAPGGSSSAGGGRGDKPRVILADVPDRKLRGGALERFDHREFGVERLFLFGITGFDLGAPALDPALRLHDVVRVDGPHGMTMKCGSDPPVSPQQC